MGTTHDDETTPPDGAPPTGLLIDGAWREARDGATIAVLAPATEARLATVAAAGAEDVDAAVRAARAQVDGGAWSRLTGAERRGLLLRLADLIERDAEALIRLEATDVGKPANDARFVDLPAALETYRYFAGWADKVDGRHVPVLPHMGRPVHAYTVREPIGVVGAIVPWNAPFMTAAWKLAPALAAGCAVVLKSPEDAPLTLQRLGELVVEAGFPPGTVNILPGLGPVAGAALARHPDVDKVSFTGSPEVGRDVGLACARDFRRVTLELGGKSPQLILADADVEAAIAGTAMGLFANQGEICAAGTRVLVAREHYDAVVEGLQRAAGAVRLGDPLAPDTTMGPLISGAHRERVSGYVDSGVADGARLVTGGGRPERPGFFVEPTVFADATNAMTIAREEIFGPVGLVMPFDDPAEAVAIANDTPFGLAAYVWTRDLGTAHALAARLRAGSVWVNGFGLPDPRMPWGGMKASGVGRELSWSGVLANTEEKAVSVVL